MARAFARTVVALRYVVVPAWAALVVAATLLLPGLGSAEPLALGGLVPEDAESLETARRSSQLFGAPLTADTAVVLRDPGGLSSEAQAEVVERALETSTRGREGGGEIALALPVLNTLELFPGAREDGTTAVTFLFFAEGTSLPRKVELARAYAAELGRPPGGLVGITGPAPARYEQFEEIQRSLPLVEAATVALIALIMGVAFRSLAAPLLALLVAAIAFLLAVRLVPWAGAGLGVTVPHEVEPLLVALTLGIVTDYCVFFLAGCRRRLGAGEGRIEAARNTTAAVAPIVGTAGLIVVAGTSALLAGELDFFRAFGPALALTAAVALVVSLTVVPACLALAGRHLFWPGLRRAADGPPPAWREAAARFALSRPISLLVVLVCGGLLAAAASGLTDTALGLRLVRGLPAEADEREATEAASRGFAQGILAPAVLLVEQEGIGAEGEALARLAEELEAQEGVAAVLGPRGQAPDLEANVLLAPAGDAARYALVLEDDPLSAPAIAALGDVEERLPALLERAGLDGAQAGVSGQTALASDTVEAVVGSSARVGAVVLAVNFLLLALFLRALVAPLYLLATSVLSVAAAYGLATFFFQGFLDHSDLTYYVPFAAGVLLVSLGSDYNVYVVGRIWQEARARPLRDAVAVAVPRASRAISIAGLTLAVSFAMLALIPVDGLREFAFLMAVGTLLEAFFVRSLLIPALVSLVGRASAWPGRLAEPRP